MTEPTPATTSPSPSPSPPLIPLRDLDPSPVDSPQLTPQPSRRDSRSAQSPNEPDHRSTPPNGNRARSPPHSSSTSLPPGLRLPSPTTTLLQLQKYSPLPFTLFLGLHLTNTSILPLLLRGGRSLHASDTYLLLTRPYYQSALLEPALILLPLATHILSGVALRLYRRRQAIRRYGADEDRAERSRIPWPRLSSQSLLGYVLVPLLVGHAVVNRGVPLWVEGGSSGVGLRFVAHGFAKHPVVANVGYGLLIAVGVWHVVGGAAKSLGWGLEVGRGEEGKGEYGQVSRRRRRSRREWVVDGVAAAIAGLWMLGGLGVVGRGGKAVGMAWEVRAWDEIYKSVPVLGTWL